MSEYHIIFYAILAMAILNTLGVILFGFLVLREIILTERNKKNNQ